MLEVLLTTVVTSSFVPFLAVFPFGAWVTFVLALVV